MKNWLLLRPGLYRDLEMVTDQELRQGGLFLHDLPEDEETNLVATAIPGDWLAIRDGIAIRLGKSIFGDTAVYT